MRLIRRLALPAFCGAGIVLIGAPAVTPRDPAPSTYRVSAGSRLDVLTGKAGVLGGFGHDHRIRARSFTGTIVYDPQSIAASSVEITVQAGNLDVLPIGADRKDAPKVEAAMREDVLHVERWPEIAFRSRSVAPIAEGVRVIGDLTLAGETRPVTVDLRLRAGGGRLLATGHFTIAQSDWGIEPYSAALGTIKVADEVTFELHVVAERIDGA